MPRKRTSRRRYSKGAQRKVRKVMREYKRGTLRGGKGRHPKVRSRAQAIAIGLSEARRAGKKAPPSRGRSRAPAGRRPTRRKKS